MHPMQYNCLIEKSGRVLYFSLEFLKRKVTMFDNTLLRNVVSANLRIVVREFLA